MPSCKTSRGRQRSWSASLEDDALSRLINHLREAGHAVDVAARPDRDRRTGRAVDAEVTVDGRIVAVEITQVLPGARAHYEIARLEKQIEAELEPRVVAGNLGYVAISIHNRRLPPKAALRAAIPILVDDIAAAMSDLEPAPRVKREVAVETSVGFIRRLELLQLPK